MKFVSKGITHSGKFHADDVFSTALLRILNPDFKVERVFKVPDDTTDCIVYDIGGGKFDHHGTDIPLHENGSRYAAFGLLWDEYGRELVKTERGFKHIEERFVSVIDESDNGGAQNLLSDVIASFNPTWDSKDERDEAFEEVVSIAVKILIRTIERENAVDRADEKVLKALEGMKDGIVILDEFVPFSKVLINTDAVYAIYPSLRGGYCAQGVPVEEGSRDVKVSFPDEWRGLEKEELQKASGIEGIEFCHKSGFMISADSVETAKAAALKSIKLRGEKDALSE